MINQYILCSHCFKDEGLKLYSEKIGHENSNECSNCLHTDGKKLDKELLHHMTYMFFVKGTYHKSTYGGASVIQYNDKRQVEIDFRDNLKEDVNLLESNMKLGLFYYGPRLWMLGEIEPLKDLINESTRKSILHRIINEYPTVKLKHNTKLYRLRINPEVETEHKQYDSPPREFLGNGRLDSSELPILYASQDIEVCIHECRVTVEDETYLATIQTNKELKLLDLTEVILEEDVDEFESLDLAIHMLFFAGNYSYDISRNIALFIKSHNYDGIIYPSYFSTIKTGSIPFDTVYGMSIRMIDKLKEYAKSQIIENIALFGRPIEEKKVRVSNINKLILNKISYDYSFGPTNY